VYLISLRTTRRGTTPVLESGWDDGTITRRLDVSVGVVLGQHVGLPARVPEGPKLTRTCQDVTSCEVVS